MHSARDLSTSLSGCCLIAICLCTCQLARPCHGAALKPHWSYSKTGGDGPDSWPSLYKRWCSGRKQSPINIGTAESAFDDSLTLYSVSEPDLTGLRYRLVNDGHKVLLSFNDAPINVSLSRPQRECFRPHHVHWHWGDRDAVGSEHRLGGRQFPMEGHVVMWDCRFWDSFEAASLGIDGLAVLGFFYEIDETRLSSGPLPALTAYFNESGVSHCDLCANESYSNPGIELPAFSIRDLLPSDMSRYFVYYGSLTTPDWRENVLWTVFSDTEKISSSVMNRFRGLQMPADSAGARAQMVNNFRSLMPLNPADPVGARRQLSRSFPDNAPVAAGTRQGGCWALVASAIAAASGFGLAV